MAKKPMISTLLTILLSFFFFSSCSQNNNLVTKNTLPSPVITNTAAPSPFPTPVSDYSKMCAWVDASDIIIQLKFADNVVNKDSSYEAGFAFSDIKSTTRLARQVCDYKTGFKYDEMKKAGVTQLIVRGYTDSNRRQLKGDPRTVIFNESGVPDVGSSITVEVLN
jgi:hypothetical protein